MTTSAYQERASLTVSNTELSIVSGTSSLQAVTTAGIYQVFIDGVANMAKGDEFLVKVKEKAVSGGTQRILQQFKISDAQSEIQSSVAWPLVNGWDITIQRTAGSDRVLDCSIRKA